MAHLCADRVCCRFEVLKAVGGDGGLASVFEKTRPTAWRSKRMLRKCAAFLVVSTMVASGVWAQGLNVPPGVTKDDWEEINFEFNSSVLVDGFPSLLRLAELLQKNPGYKVKVEGHTDIIGGTQFNDRLGLARANAV